MRKTRNNHGFTLIELMIVVVIIGILAAIAIPRFTAVSEQAKQAEAEPILKQMCSLAEAFEMRTGAWPTATTDAGLGWSEPNAKYYEDWTFGDGRTATTVKTAAASTGMQTPSMSCNDKIITWS